MQGKITQLPDKTERKSIMLPDKTWKNYSRYLIRHDRLENLAFLWAGRERVCFKNKLSIASPGPPFIRENFIHGLKNSLSWELFKVDGINLNKGERKLLKGFNFTYVIWKGCRNDERKALC